MSDVPPPLTTYEFAGFRLDPRRRALDRADGAPVEITAKVYDALVYLVVRAGRTVSRQELMTALWPRTVVEDNNLNKLIASLRRALGDRGETPIVATVAGRGYQFVADVRVVQAPAALPSGADSEVVASDGGLRPGPARTVPLLPLQDGLLSAQSRSQSDRASARWWPRASVVAVALLATVAVGVGLRRWWPDAGASQAVTLQRLTDLVGNEDSPAIAPDGNSVAFVAPAAGVRHVWVRLLSGGAAVRVTQGRSDHLEPRWAPDGGSLIYFTPGETPGELGSLWEISALGGEPRRLTAALGGGDISRDGRSLAVFRFTGERTELVTLTRDGSQVVRRQPLETGGKYLYPRWSPDGQWLAFQRIDLAFVQQVFVVEADGGTPRLSASASRLPGFSWIEDSSGLVYSSSAGSSVLYPPTTNLRLVQRDGSGDRQLTFGDVSYAHPDVLATGSVAVSRTRIQSDLWRFPVDGSPLENTRAALRITRQTGQVQTASVSPDGTQIAYLSDSGGHGNVWITSTDGSSARQVTVERDPAVSIGVPIWSSTSDQIAFIRSFGGVTGLAAVRADGSGLRELVRDGIGASWSGDDRWIFYATRDRLQCIERLHAETGTTEDVRCDNAGAPAVAADGTSLYYVKYLDVSNGSLDSEIRRASPPNGESIALARVSGTRVPVTPGQLVPTLSKDGSALAMPLMDGDTTNIWTLSTAGGAMQPVTDFGDRSVLIARRVAWSPDRRYIYASVADVDSDIMLMDGLLR
jgi:Tol biopolymer transport system component/DNA-binding winged helix-turn-helix (wHTH) protein